MLTGTFDAPNISVNQGVEAIMLNRRQFLSAVAARAAMFARAPRAFGRRHNTT